MQKYKIELPKLNDVKDFVNIAQQFEPPIRITNKDFTYIGNAKSVLNVMASLEWDDLYVFVEEEIPNLYFLFDKYIVEDV